jgi:hypothetical protein
MPVALPNVDFMRMVEKTGMVDRGVIMLEHHDARLVKRAVLLEKVNRVGDHGVVPSGALPKRVRMQFHELAH